MCKNLFKVEKISVCNFQSAKLLLQADDILETKVVRFILLPLCKFSDTESISNMH